MGRDEVTPAHAHVSQAPARSSEGTARVRRPFRAHALLILSAPYCVKIS